MMQAATTQIATSSIKPMDPTAAPMITVVLLPSKHSYRKSNVNDTQLYCTVAKYVQQNFTIVCKLWFFFFFFAHWTKTGYSWSVLNQVYKQVACYTECYMLLQMEKQSSHKGCKQAVVFFL